MKAQTGSTQEQDKYNSYLLDVLRERLFESGSDLSKALKEKFGVTDDYSRKIISRAAESELIKSTKPLKFGKGQYLYLLPNHSLDIDQLVAVCKKFRPPIYRLLSFMKINNGIISYYEALKITASPVEESTTKVQSLTDILKLLDKLEFIHEKKDDNNVNYILFKSSKAEDKVVIEDIEKTQMSNHYSKMVLDCSLIPDILRWLTKSNIISNLNPIYRNKKTPSYGALHNNLLWDAFSYTKTTGINKIHGVQADSPEKQTLVVFDIVLSMPYYEFHLDGFLNRVQININSIKKGERKILPIIIYKECDSFILNKIAKLGFIAFEISSIFGTRIHSVLQELSSINSIFDGDGNIEKNVKSILKTIREAGQEDALKDLHGVLFEFLMYPLLTAIYPNSFILRGKTLMLHNNGVKEGGYEYDYIINSSNPREIIIVELKGYNSSATIPLGEPDKKNSLKWFFQTTFPFAQKYYKKEISEGCKIKAVYMTTANFWEDGKKYLETINNGKLKPLNLDVGYQRNELIKLLEARDFKKEVEVIKEFYTKESDL